MKVQKLMKIKTTVDRRPLSHEKVWYVSIFFVSLQCGLQLLK